MSVKKRLKSFIKNQKIAISTFEKDIKVSNGYVNSISKGIGGEVLLKILEKFPNINIEWLLTGNGDMFKNGNISQNIVGNGSNILGNGNIMGGINSKINTSNSEESEQLIDKLESQITFLTNQIKEKDTQISNLINLLGKK